MTYIVKPQFHHPSLPTNKLGFTRRDYEGRVSTLCAGCGHDSISAAIVQACFEIDLEPHRLAKLSGIGTERLVFFCFVNMGMLAALAGMMVTARLNSATPRVNSRKIAICSSDGPMAT